MNTSAQLCTFHLGDLFFGLDVMSVQEVIRSPELALVPLAPATIEGLLNLRGQILTAIDLRRLLGLPARAKDDAGNRMLMILRTENEHVALIVDSVGDVMDVDESTFESPPDSVPAAVRHVVLGVHKLDGVLLHVLDHHAVGKTSAQFHNLAA